MPLGIKFDPTRLADRQANLAVAREAVNTLDTIIAGVVGGTALQTQQAVREIAKHQKALIKVVAGELA